MKTNKITVCIHDSETNKVVDQIDKGVPNIFNTFDVCDFCEEKTNCNDCIVQTLQLEKYFIKK